LLKISGYLRAPLLCTSYYVQAIMYKLLCTSYYVQAIMYKLLCTSYYVQIKTGDYVQKKGAQPKPHSLFTPLFFL